MSFSCYNIRKQIRATGIGQLASPHSDFNCLFLLAQVLRSRLTQAGLGQWWALLCTSSGKWEACAFFPEAVVKWGSSPVIWLYRGLSYNGLVGWEGLPVGAVTLKRCNFFSEWNNHQCHGQADCALDVLRTSDDLGQLSWESQRFGLTK